MEAKDWQWLAEWMFDQLTEDEKKRLEAAAEKRMEKISEAVAKYPDMPATMAEIGLEHFINHMNE